MRSTNARHRALSNGNLHITLDTTFSDASMAEKEALCIIRIRPG